MSSQVINPGRCTDPLLVRLVYRIKCVLDGDALEVPRRHLDPERELEVDLLDRRRREQLLQDVLVIHAARRRVDLPVAGHDCQPGL